MPSVSFLALADVYPVFITQFDPEVMLCAYVMWPWSIKLHNMTGTFLVFTSMWASLPARGF